MRVLLIVSFIIPTFLLGSILPEGFVENMGQVDGDVAFYTIDGVKIHRDGRVSYGNVEFRLKDANFSSIEGLAEVSRLNLLRKVPYRNLSVYRKVILRDVYPGVDFVITPVGKSVEFQWFVHPGGRAEDIEIEVLKGSLSFSGVRAFQGSREVEVSIEKGENGIRFIVGEFDRSSTLVIDPIAFISNNVYEAAYGVNVDDSGYVYVTGYVSSTTGMGDWDVFVSKLSPDLSNLVSTAIIYGDSGYYDLAFSVDFDASGNVYIAGWTFDTVSFGQNVVVYGTRGIVDAFVMKLNSSLDSIISTAIITSPSIDQAFSVYYRNDTVYVGGVASDADNFSISRTIFGTHAGTYDMNAFVTALSSDLMSHYATAIVASPSSDYAEGIYAGEGRIYLFGYTYDPAGFSSDRVVYGPVGNGDAFVSVLSSDLLQHIQSVIIGSDSLDIARGVLEVDSGRVVVAGLTHNAPQFSIDRTIQGSSGNDDIFITLLDSTLYPIRTLIVASPSSDGIFYGSDRSLALVGGKLALYGYSDFITAIGGSLERVMCGTGGSSDAIIVWINSSIDSAVAISVPTGNGSDEASGDMVYRNATLYFAGTIASTYDATTYYGPTYSYGVQDDSDVFAGYIEGDCVPTVKDEKQSRGVVLRGDILRVIVNEPAYVGFDIYNIAGRKVMSRSAGYLLPGEYEFDVEVPSGVYLMKIRIGNDVIDYKFVK